MYHCQLKRAPKFSTKHHLIKVDPLIEEENKGLVHHVVIYACYDAVDREHYFDGNNTSFDCLVQANMPPDVYSCKTPITVWGVGGGPMYYPEEAGFPFGDEDSPDYIVMEMHYDNPQLLSGRRDSSGFRLTFTPTLRKYDAGILTLGAVHGIAIPPKVKDFTSSGFCTNTCTQRIALNTHESKFGE
ncbi:dopamine beta-hydroxylase-like [Watersipora subatra]|uniref:dopamine beta-hydroxylase-like n=1 Tax=Watersipora subatra TaxID=2589382 RepID=UPI00355BBAA3